MAQAKIRIDDALRPETSTLDLSKVGQNGVAFNLQAISNNTPYTKNPLFIQLVRAPKAFKIHPDGEALTAALKRLIERHPKNWQGFVQPLEIETMQVPNGWDRQMLTIPTNVTRGPIQPSLTADKLYDEADASFWNYYIETFLSHPTTQRPNYAELSSHPDDWLVDQYTFDIIAWEPDMTYTKAIKAWACAAMLPTNSVEITGQRDIANAHQQEEYTITFATIYDSSVPVVETATQLMKAMTLHSSNPNYKPTYFSEITAEVTASSEGILEENLAHAANWTNS